LNKGDEKPIKRGRGSIARNAAKEEGGVFHQVKALRDKDGLEQVKCKSEKEKSSRSGMSETRSAFPRRGG